MTKHMWFVTRPTPDSELVDILFEADWARLALQFRGGLDPDEIVGMYYHELQARNVAQSLIDVRDGTLDPAMVT